jgi:hypothetical protein
METLGFEDPVEITKSEIARVQLAEAIELFLVGKYLPGITLAGAAEEILARLLNQKGEGSIVERSIELILELREQTALPVMGGKTKKEIFNEWNAARNQLKHHNEPEEEVVSINLFDEAYWMIRRALSNASKLGVQIENEREFENWVITNINM